MNNKKAKLLRKGLNTRTTEEDYDLERHEKVLVTLNNKFEEVKLPVITMVAKLKPKTDRAKYKSRKQQYKLNKVA